MVTLFQFSEPKVAVRMTAAAPARDVLNDASAPEWQRLLAAADAEVGVLQRALQRELAAFALTIPREVQLETDVDYTSLEVGLQAVLTVAYRRVMERAGLIAADYIPEFIIEELVWEGEGAIRLFTEPEAFHGDSHDEKSHGNRGGGDEAGGEVATAVSSQPPATRRSPYADDPRVFNKPDEVAPSYPWRGAPKPDYWAWKNEKGEPSGHQLTGEPVDRKALPFYLYHVTTNGSAVGESGVLLGQRNQGAGMGGGQADGVSFTTNFTDAVVIHREMVRAVRIAKGLDKVDSFDRYAKEDAALAGVPLAQTQGAANQAKEWYQWNINNEEARRSDPDWKHPPRYNTPESRAQLMDDAMNQYLSRRHHDNRDVELLKNPVLFTRPEVLRTLDPDNVVTFEVPKANLPATALITTGSDKFLHEVRAYSDVPIKGSRVLQTRKQFSEALAFHGDSHNEKDHAGKGSGAGDDVGDEATPARVARQDTRVPTADEVQDAGESKLGKLISSDLSDVLVVRKANLVSARDMLRLTNEMLVEAKADKWDNVEVLTSDKAYYEARIAELEARGEAMLPSEATGPDRSRHKARISQRLADTLEAEMKQNPKLKAQLEAAIGGELQRKDLEQYTSDFIHTWAESAADTNPPSLGIQREIAAMFNLPIPSYLDQPYDSVKLEVKEWEAAHGEAARVMLREQYRGTQRDLREAGVKEVIVYRGADLAWPDAYRETLRTKSQISLQPLSSFSVEYGTAVQFSGDRWPTETSTITAMVVPASRVFATTRTGFGALHEGEVVVLGGDNLPAYVRWAEAVGGGITRRHASFQEFRDEVKNRRQEHHEPLAFHGDSHDEKDHGKRGKGDDTELSVESTPRRKLWGSPVPLDPASFGARASEIKAAAKIRARAEAEQGARNLTGMVMDTYSGTFAGFSTIVDRVENEGTSEPIVYGSIYNKDMVKVGHFERTVFDNGAVVFHDEIKLDEKYQGGGFAREFNRQAENFYLANGVENIRLRADVDVGGYAWARQGYDFVSKEVLNSTQGSLYDKLDRLSIASAQRDQAIRLIREAQHSWDLAGIDIPGVTFPGPNGKPMHLGKKLMLGSDWQGVKNLDPVDITYLVGEESYRSQTGTPAPARRRKRTVKSREVPASDYNLHHELIDESVEDALAFFHRIKELTAPSRFHGDSHDEKDHGNRKGIGGDEGEKEVLAHPAIKALVLSPEHLAHPEVQRLLKAAAASGKLDEDSMMKLQEAVHEARQGNISYREFTSEEGYEWHAQQAEWAKSLTKDEVSDLTSYASFSYHQVNGLKRAGPDPDMKTLEAMHLTKTERRPATEAEVAQVRAAIKDLTDDKITREEYQQRFQTADGGKITGAIGFSVEIQVPDHENIARYRELGDRIDRVIREKGVTITEPMSVLRAAYIPGMSDQDVAALEGKIYTERGLTSTMVGSAGDRLETYIANGKAESIYDRHNGNSKVEEVGAALSIKIDLPPGTKVAAIEAVRQLQSPGHRSESEVLLMSDSRFRVKSVKLNAGTSNWMDFSTPYHEIVLEYIG